MKGPELYGPREFSGILFLIVVKKTKTEVQALKNSVSYIDLITKTPAEFNKYYKLKESTAETLRHYLEGFKQYAIDAGMTPAAATVLPKFIDMTKEEIEVAASKGKKTQTKIRDDAAGEEAKDVASGKAPRKLAGAALLAKQRREAREREEAEANAARQAAADASESLTEAEKAGAPDVRVDTLAAKVKGDPMQKKRKADAVEKQVKAARSSKFDPASLKGSDGKYKSASAMFKGLILENESAKKPLSDEQIFKKVQGSFDLSDDKLGYVKWNRGWLVRQGIIKSS